MTTAIAEYSKTEAALADLAQRYKGVLFDVSTKEGLATAVKGRAELRGYRMALEKTRVEIKAPALKRAQEIDSEARRITAELLSLETPIDDQIKADERKKEAERVAKEKAEADRIAAEAARIKDAEEKVMAAQRAEIARQQEELAAKQRAQAQADAEARLKIADEQRAAREKIEAEERVSRLAREEADRVARLAREAEEAKAKAARDAEDARLKAERDKIEAERRAVEEAQRKEREAEEAKQRTILREQAELSDGMDMLKLFVQRFGKRDEFKFVVDAINKYLKVTP
jgi:hypothetical protein